MDDSISRVAAIELIRTLYPGAPIMRANIERWKEKYKQYIECEKALEQLPSLQPTLYGYDVRHLALIAEVLQKENLPPERVAEVLNDVSSIVSVVLKEFEESLRNAVYTSWYDFSNQGSGKER